MGLNGFVLAVWRFLAFLFGMGFALAVVAGADYYFPGVWVPLFYCAAVTFLLTSRRELAIWRPLKPFIATWCTGTLWFWMRSATLGTTEGKLSTTDPIVVVFMLLWFASIIWLVQTVRRGAASGAIRFGLLLLLCSWAIGFLSSNSGGASPMIQIVQSLFHADYGTAYNIVFVLRKIIHFTFYGTVSLVALGFLFRTVGRERSLLWLALCIALALAAFDELRQSGMTQRTGSVYDVLLDLSGVAVFLGFAWRRESRIRPKA